MIKLFKGEGRTKTFITAAKEDLKGNVILRTFCLWLITGGVYYLLEGLWRIKSNGGWANIAMVPIGGLCGVLIGMMNENSKFTKKKMAVQALYGTAVLIVVEFACGYILNIALGLGIWDYSGLPFNLMGQICLPFAILWYLFTPFIIWFDDYTRYKLWGQGEPYPFYRNYVQLFTLK